MGVALVTALVATAAVPAPVSASEPVCVSIDLGKVLIFDEVKIDLCPSVPTDLIGVVPGPTDRTVPDVDVDPGIADPTMWAGTNFLTLSTGERIRSVGFSTDDPDSPCEPWRSLPIIVKRLLFDKCEDDSFSQFGVSENPPDPSAGFGDPILCVHSATITIDSEDPDFHFSTDEGVTFSEPPC